MKKIIASTLMFTFLVGAGFVTTPTVNAQVTADESAISIQERLIAALWSLIERLRGEDSMMHDDMMKDGTYTLTLDTDLAELAEGYYEGWVIVGEDKISTGLFKDGGEQTFSIDVDPSTIDKVAVTIEPAVDPDPAPSGIIALVGELDGDGADLAFPVDFSAAAGSAILATPSDDDSSNETSGVWFLSVPGPAASLELPELPTGWVYEGWAVYEDTPLTTGRFTAGNEADDFVGFSGPNDTPNYPGEDFLENAPAGLEFPINLADGASKIVISVEPDIDGVDPTGDGPAQVKPLLVAVDEDQGDHENINLEQHLESLPSGTAMIK